MKHWVFDYFGGFMPWRYAADTEFINREDQLINVEKINILFFKSHKNINFIEFSYFSFSISIFVINFFPFIHKLIYYNNLSPKY